jgi:hypothetical protein
MNQTSPFSKKKKKNKPKNQMVFLKSNLKEKNHKT